MDQVRSKKIVMKPRWYFVLGSVLSIFGLVSFGVLATFLASLSMFLLRQHGPRGQWRLEQIIDSFPVWIPFFAIFGIIAGVNLLRQYDFSYKKNFKQIILIFISSILLSAAILDYSGLGDFWFKRGPMKNYYQQRFEKNGQDDWRGFGGQYRKQNYKINN